MSDSVDWKAILDSFEASTAQISESNERLRQGVAAIQEAMQKMSSAVEDAQGSFILPEWTPHIKREWDRVCAEYGIDPQDKELQEFWHILTHPS